MRIKLYVCVYNIYMYTIVNGSVSPVYSGRCVGLATHFHLTSKLKKEYRHTSTPILGLRVPNFGNLYLYIYNPNRYISSGTNTVNLHFIQAVHEGTPHLIYLP